MLRIVLTVAIRPFQVALTLVVAMALLASVTKLAFGFFTFALVEFGTDKPKMENDDEQTEIGEKASDDSFATDDSSFAIRDVVTLKRAIAKTQERGRQIGDIQQQLIGRESSLKQLKDSLSTTVEQRRSALQNAEKIGVDVQQIESLRALKDNLERQVAAQRLAVNQAEQKRSQMVAKVPEKITPQIIECVQGAVVLLPQQERISLAEIGGGQIAGFAKKNGVYFVVRPSGFDSFIAARKIAASAGTVVGYEPMEPGVTR